MGAVASAVSLYRYIYDNILLFPALLMALRLAITRQGTQWQLLAVAMALSLWTPQRIIDRVPMGGQAPELDADGKPLVGRPTGAEPLT